jgi:hypothetical protein
MHWPVTRPLLASFIECAAKGCVTPSEWHRFAHSHYQDEEMEFARAECVKTFIESQNYTKSHRLSQEEQNVLFELASKLRLEIT